MVNTQPIFLIFFILICSIFPAFEYFEAKTSIKAKETVAIDDSSTNQLNLIEPQLDAKYDESLDLLSPTEPIISAEVLLPAEAEGGEVDVADTIENTDTTDEADTEEPAPVSNQEVEE